MWSWEKIKYLHSSGLKLYKECPFKFYLKYVEGVDIFQGNVAFAIGTHFHNGMEQLYKIGDPNQAKIKFRNGLPGNIKEKNIQVVNNLTEALNVYSVTQFPKYKDRVLDQEITCSVRLKNVDVPLTGRIDLVLRDGIVDFKTTSSSDRRTMYSREQLFTYAMFFWKKYKYLPQTLEIHYFNKLTTGTGIIQEKVTANDINCMVAEYQQLWRDIKAERWTPNVAAWDPKDKFYNLMVNYVERNIE